MRQLNGDGEKKNAHISWTFSRQAPSIIDAEFDGKLPKQKNDDGLAK